MSMTLCEKMCCCTSVNALGACYDSIFIYFSVLALIHLNEHLKLAHITFKHDTQCVTVKQKMKNNITNLQV